MKRKTFPEISVDAFVAETDRKALESLKKIPILPKVIEKFHESGVDRWMYCQNMAVSVRCGPRQYPSLHNILQDCCEIMDMPVPELYISNNPFTNAFAGGVQRSYITLRSSIVDALDEDGLYHLIGHELGHIKAGHVLFMSIAQSIIRIMELMGRRTFGLSDAAQIAMIAAFFEWSRQAEFTADRAGLLCSQDFETSASVNMMLAGGPNRLSEESNLDAFLDQARTYQNMDFLDSLGKILIFMTYGMMTTHPFPVHRVRDLEQWHDEGNLTRILAGNYPKVKTETTA